MTLITPAWRFDQFLDGHQAALDDQEKEGLQPFIDTGCAACQNGVNIGGQAYFPFGVVERPGSDILPPDDKGRFAVTQTASDEYVFRAVPLRNVALTALHFHSGQVWDLEQAVAVMSTAQLGPSSRTTRSTRSWRSSTRSPANSRRWSTRSCPRARMRPPCRS